MIKSSLFLSCRMIDFLHLCNLYGCWNTSHEVAVEIWQFGIPFWICASFDGFVLEASRPPKKKKCTYTELYHFGKWTEHQKNNKGKNIWQDKTEEFQLP